MSKILIAHALDTIDVRDAFFDALYDIMAKDKRVIVLTVDQGAFSLERIKNEFPKQYYNVGIAEQNLICVAAGLAMGGQIPFVYGISTFMTMRCYEQIRNNLCCMNLPVTIIGSGPGYTYGSDGPTHHSIQDIAIMRALPSMAIYSPVDATSTSACARMAYEMSGPKYIRLEKGILPVFYQPGHDFSRGFEILRFGQDILIISTGIMVNRAIEVAEVLSLQGFKVGVVDIYRLKPVNDALLLEVLSFAKRIITLEEHSVIGGIGSVISDLVTDNGLSRPFKKIALPDCYCYEYGNRERLPAYHRLDVKTVTTSILSWVS